MILIFDLSCYAKWTEQISRLAQQPLSAKLFLSDEVSPFVPVSSANARH